MMKDIHFSLATNWDNKLIDAICSLENIKELWGTLPFTPIGSGRYGFGKISRKATEKHIHYAKNKGLKFCYLLNAPCLEGKEHSKNFQKNILEYLKWLHNIGIDIIVISSPFLIEIVKRNFPDLKIKLSVIAKCDSIEKLKRFMDLGCDIVTLDFDKNRNFKFLKNAVKIFSNIELLTSDSCLYNCNMKIFHYCEEGHKSQKKNKKISSLPWYEHSYYMLSCAFIKYNDLSELIKSRWIRPDDIQEYYNLGIRRFKIGSRYKTTAWLVNCAKAYSNLFYDGNLSDILENHYFKIPKIKDEKIIYIDNKKLSNFLNFFKKINCDEINCKSCKYCDEIAKQCISVIDKKNFGKYITHLKKYKDKYW